MNEVAEYTSSLAAILTSVFLLGGALVTLIGAVGLLRFPNFYQRVHAPTLGTTLGTGCIALASMIYFSTLSSGLVMRELLIVIFVTMTTPISLMLLVRAAVYRERFEKEVQPARSEDESCR
jgi:multicomponent K+:H+ antiporter subunit G